MAVSKMIEHGWLQEVDANLRRNEPLWRETGDGHGTTLVVTDAGLLAIGIEPGDLFHPGLVDAGNVACRVEADAQDRLVMGMGALERFLAGVLRNVEPALVAELADKAWAAQRRFHRLAVVDARLHRID